MNNPIEQGLANRIQEVLATKPVVTRIDISRRHTLKSTFTLPYGNFIIGSVNYPSPWKTDTRIAMHVDYFEVNELMRENGIGTKLMKALVADAKNHGAIYAYGHIARVAVLKTRAKVFGRDNLTFYYHFSFFEQEPQEPLGITFDEVIDRKYFPLYVVSDLTKIDTTGWE